MGRTADASIGIGAPESPTETAQYCARGSVTYLGEVREPAAYECRGCLRTFSGVGFDRHVAAARRAATAPAAQCEAVHPRTKYRCLEKPGHIGSHSYLFDGFRARWDDDDAPSSPPRKTIEKPRAKSLRCSAMHPDTNQRCAQTSGHADSHSYRTATQRVTWLVGEQLEMPDASSPRPRKAHAPTRSPKAQPPAKYFGGKNTIFRQIINLIPQHARFVELFAGSAAVSRHLARGSAEAWVIELDQEQVGKLRDRRELAGHRVVHGDALLWLETELQIDSLGPETVLFVDPPYPIDDRRDPRPRYRHELDQEQHARLLTLLKLAASRGVRVLVCGHPWGLYTTELQSWRKHEFTIGLRSGRAGVECVWTSYDDPFPLHDYRYFGDNKQVRQDLRRRVTRQLELFGAMDKHARAAILRELAAAYPLECGAAGQAPAPTAAGGSARPAPSARSPRVPRASRPGRAAPASPRAVAP